MTTSPVAQMLCTCTQNASKVKFQLSVAKHDGAHALQALCHWSLRHQVERARRQPYTCVTAECACDAQETEVY